MNEFNVLLNAATNGTPSGSLFDALFARYIAPQESWRELESPLPITILAAGEDLIDYRIYGNTEDGESVGGRTENLFDKNANDVANGYEEGKVLQPNGTSPPVPGQVNYITTEYMAIPNNATNLTLVKNSVSNISGICFYDANKEYISGISNKTNIIPAVISCPTGAVYFRTVISKQYINEAMVVPGSTAPASYIPYGYQLPMVVRSRNLFDVSKAQSSYVSVEGDTIHKSLTGYFYDLNCFTTGANTNGDVDKMIPIKAGVYTVSCTSSSSSNLQIAIRYFDGVGQKYIYSAARLPYSFNVPNDGKISMRVSNDIALDIKGLKICPGSTVPTEYIPYYRDEENIYIGSDPLAEDEYVDFGEQKIYRMEGGTLTPTDPPVPIPALPTIQGETIIDYNPSTTPAVEPEKMYVKYKPQ